MCCQRTCRPMEAEKRSTEGWTTHRTLYWSWVLSEQSQIRVLSEPATAEQGWLAFRSPEPKRLACKIYSPHQRVEPPGEMIFSSPATVPTRVLAKARRDKRVNNIFLLGSGLRRARGRRKKNVLTRGATVEPRRFNALAWFCTPSSAAHTPRSQIQYQVHTSRQTRASTSRNTRGTTIVPQCRPLGLVDWDEGFARGLGGTG